MSMDKDIQVVSVTSRKMLRDFIYLPRILHVNHLKWVPPIYSDEWNYFNPRKNPAHSYCDVEMAICLYHNKPVGRIMGAVNHRYNSVKQEKTVRFSNFESIDNPEVSASLLDHIEKWGREKGMNGIIGPFGMCYHDPIGFLIEGFEHEPSISTYYNFEYLPGLLEMAGYRKKYDLVAYKIDIEDDVPEFYNRIRDRVLKKGNIRMLKFSSKKEMKKMVMPLLALFNECYLDIDGYSPLDDREMQILAKQYIPVLDPDYVRMVYVNDEPAAFMIGMPNISQGIRASGGKLFPFGFIKILKAFKTATQLDFLLAGIKKKFQGIGVEVLMGYDIIYSAKRNNFKFIDSHLEMESNYKVRAEMEKLRGQVYKKYRLYQKEI
jgi:hypothetical protein